MLKQYELMVLALASSPNTEAAAKKKITVDSDCVKVRESALGYESCQEAVASFKSDRLFQYHVAELFRLKLASKHCSLAMLTLAS